jgi:uncharacterized DUF497 family protein
VLVVHWTPDAEHHFGRHGVTAIDVDDLLRDRHFFKPNRRGPGRISVVGRTGTGKVLEVAFDPTSDPHEWIPVTAVEASADDRRRLLRGT